MQTHLRSSRARRRLVVAALGGMGAIVAAPFARGQGRFPAKPVRLIVPFGPGGLADISARMTAERLGERLGQAVVIDNRPGAGGVVAAQAALNAPRDGHTIVLFSN